MLLTVCMCATISCRYLEHSQLRIPPALPPVAEEMKSTASLAAAVSGPAVSDKEWKALLGKLVSHSLISMIGQWSTGMTIFISAATRTWFGLSLCLMLHTCNNCPVATIWELAGAIADPSTLCPSRPAVRRCAGQPMPALQPRMKKRPKLLSSTRSFRLRSSRPKPRSRH